MVTRRIIVPLTALSLCLLFSHSAQAKLIKCWFNKAELRECASNVPPEFSQSRIEIVNERGLVVRVIDAAKTPAELRRQRELDLAAKEIEDLRKERARLDRVLLNAYTTERDLLLARDNNLKAAQGQIDIARGNLKLLQSNYNDYQQRAANYERTGGKPPPGILKKLEKFRKLIEQKNLHIENKISSKNELQTRFKRDIARFQELKRGRFD